MKMLKEIRTKLKMVIFTRKKAKKLSFLLLLISINCISSNIFGQEVLNFNTGWQYASYDDPDLFKLGDEGYGYQDIALPHSNIILDKHDEFQRSHFRFISSYRRHFTLPNDYQEKRIIIEFEAIATIAEVYINEQKVAVHEGAYTPFSIDITDYVRWNNEDNLIAVRVDSREQKEVPPEGGNVDFWIFGGIVRDVKMKVVNPIYFENLFVWNRWIEKGAKTDLNIELSVINQNKKPENIVFEVELIDINNSVIANSTKTYRINPDISNQIKLEISEIVNPVLWDIDKPYLYTVIVSAKKNNKVIHQQVEKFGFRYFGFDKNTGIFSLNGRKLELFGLNRHETYPWIGRAVPNRLQRKDAEILKFDLGCNVVRTSHYPQDPAFLERCDEIGLLVFEEIPGWNYIGNEKWKKGLITDLEKMIVRDRNHPSIICWGTRVNESSDNDSLYFKTNRLAHELDPTRLTYQVKHQKYPSNDSFLEDIYGKNYSYKPFRIPWVVTEAQDDWQRAWPSAHDTILITQALEFADVHDKGYASDSIAGVIGWSYVDYNTKAYVDDAIFISGVYDIFRQPKHAAWFYKSQASPKSVGPMIYIANYRYNDSPEDIIIFSNCDKVKLFAGEKRVESKPVMRFTHLPYPVYEFKGVKHALGNLYAVGYIDGEKVASYQVNKPGKAIKLKLKADFDTIYSDGSDMTPVVITAIDSSGQRVFYANQLVAIDVEGAGRMIGENPIRLEGGRAIFYVRPLFGKSGSIYCKVSSRQLEEGIEVIRSIRSTENFVPGAHIIKIKYIKIDDNSAMFTYDENWNFIREKQSVKSPDVSAWKGTYHESKITGSKVFFEFTGLSIQLFGVLHRNGGEAKISLDGKELMNINTKNDDYTHNALLYSSSQLSFGKHIIEIETLGSGTFRIDAASVQIK